MGQKINPNILRLGVNQNWKTEFFEKKTKEFAHFTFIDLEIKSYLERFLDMYGLVLHDYKIHHTNSVINIFISYAIRQNFKFNSTTRKKKIKLLNVDNQQKIVTFKNDLKTINSGKKVKNIELKKLASIKQDDKFKIKNYLKKFDYQLHSKKSTNKNLVNSNDLNTIDMQNTIKKLIKGLQVFKNNKNPVFLHFECINKNFDLNLKQKKSLRKKLMTIQKFKSSPFFNEGINLLFLVVTNKNSAKLLSKFISTELKKIKRHKFFMTFLKKSLSILLSSTFSKVMGIKIKIKGRLNDAQRASHKIIDVGNIPVQSIKRNINFSESILHDTNGSYGVKVYIVDKTH